MCIVVEKAWYLELIYDQVKHLKRKRELNASAESAEWVRKVIENPSNLGDLTLYLLTPCTPFLLFFPKQFLLSMEKYYKKNYQSLIEGRSFISTIFCTLDKSSFSFHFFMGWSMEDCP